MDYCNRGVASGQKELIYHNMAIVKCGLFYLDPIFLNPSACQTCYNLVAG